MAKKSSVSTVARDILVYALERRGTDGDITMAWENLFRFIDVPVKVAVDKGQIAIAGTESNVAQGWSIIKDLKELGVSPHADLAMVELKDYVRDLRSYPMV